MENTASGHAFGGEWDVADEIYDSDIVVTAVVEDEAVVEVNNEDRQFEAAALGGVLFWRDLTLNIEEVHKGDLVAPGERVRLRDTRGFVETPDGERIYQIIGGTLVLPGDRVFIALNNTTSEGISLPDFEPGAKDLYVQRTHDAVLFIEDGRVIDTGRHSPAIEEHEGMSEAELRERASREGAEAEA